MLSNIYTYNVMNYRKMETRSFSIEYHSTKYKYLSEWYFECNIVPYCYYEIEYEPSMNCIQYLYF